MLCLIPSVMPLFFKIRNCFRVIVLSYFVRIYVNALQIPVAMGMNMTSYIVEDEILHLYHSSKRDITIRYMGKEIGHSLEEEVSDIKTELGICRVDASFREHKKKLKG